MNFFGCGHCGERFGWDPNTDDHPYPKHAHEKHLDKHPDHVCSDLCAQKTNPRFDEWRTLPTTIHITAPEDGP